MYNEILYIVVFTNLKNGCNKITRNQILTFRCLAVFGSIILRKSNSKVFTYFPTSPLWITKECGCLKKHVNFESFQQSTLLIPLHWLLLQLSSSIWPFLFLVLQAHLYLSKYDNEIIKRNVLTFPFLCLNPPVFERIAPLAALPFLFIVLKKLCFVNWKLIETVWKQELMVRNVNKTDREQNGSLGGVR